MVFVLGFCCSVVSFVKSIMILPFAKKDFFDCVSLKESLFRFHRIMKTCATDTVVFFITIIS